MSIRIKLSYETDEELSSVRKDLAKYTPRVKLEPSKGRFKRAYLFIKSMGKNSAKADDI